MINICAFGLAIVLPKPPPSTSFQRHSKNQIALNGNSNGKCGKQALRLHTETEMIAPVPLPPHASKDLLFLLPSPPLPAQATHKTRRRPPSAFGAHPTPQNVFHFPRAPRTSIRQQPGKQATPTARLISSGRAVLLFVLPLLFPLVG